MNPWDNTPSYSQEKVTRPEDPLQTPVLGKSV